MAAEGVGVEPFRAALVEAAVVEAAAESAVGALAAFSASYSFSCLPRLQRRWVERTNNVKEASGKAGGWSRLEVGEPASSRTQCSSRAAGQG